MGLPWYRVHTVVLHDPGRLLSVHIMHTFFFQRLKVRSSFSASAYEGFSPMKRVYGFDSSQTRDNE